MGNGQHFSGRLLRFGRLLQPQTRTRTTRDSLMLQRLQWHSAAALLRSFNWSLIGRSMEASDMTGSIPPTWQPEGRLSLQDLCPSCSKVDFEAAIANPTAIGARHIDIDSEQIVCEKEIHSLKTLQPACPLCQMFLKLIQSQLSISHRHSGVPEINVLLRSTNRDRPWNGLMPL